jgi:hypothetical protein
VNAYFKRQAMALCRPQPVSIFATAAITPALSGLHALTSAKIFVS